MGKAIWIVAIVATLAGLGMLAGSGWTLGSTLKFRKEAQTTDGVVVDFATSRSDKGKTMYSPIVEYRDLSGTSRQLTSSVSSSSPGYDRGDKVQVRFLPQNPEQARIDSFLENWFLPLILGGLGLIFFGVGIGAFVAGITKARNRKWLAANGMRVQARYTGTIHDTSLKVNNRSPWRLTAQWQHPVTAAMHTFKSDPIWYDPTDVVQRDTLDVLVNADNPKVYEVDIAFLPKSA
jgi:hypothetical protein